MGASTENRGLLPRCFEYLFAEMAKIQARHKLSQMSSSSGQGNRKSAESGANSAGKSLYNQAMFKDDRVQEIEFDIKCSYVEIYNETIYDLLDPCGQTKLQIREDRGSPFLENCTERHVKNLNSVMSLIKQGQESRHVASTSMNLESSRSHAVFTATIKTQTILADGQKVVRTSRFHVVDLAGSERVKDTNAAGQRMKELCKINASLSNLGKVIYELSENSKREGSKKQPSFVNFRQSKLTHLLKDSLGGNSKTVMICTLNPHASAIKETISTLKFAQRAKMIKNKAIVNEENSNAEYWKLKYMNLARQMGSTPNEGISSGLGTKSSTKRSVFTDSFQGESEQGPCAGWRPVLTKQVKEQTDLLKEAHQEVSKMVKQLKLRETDE